MSHIKLYPEEACYIPEAGKEAQCIEIINKYANLMQSQSGKESSAVTIPTINDADIHNSISEAYELIDKASYDGNVVAEKALIALDKLFDDDFPNYFVVRGDLNYNIMMVERGDAYSMGMLGDRYYYGKDVKQNYAKAVEWYQKAAELGVELAQYNLAGCYEEGRGAAKDRPIALDWYKKAAAQGLYEAKRAVLRMDMEDKYPDSDLASYLPTYYLEGEYDTSILDEYGVRYSADGKRLMSAPEKLVEYKIKQGTEVICDGAFYDCKDLQTIEFPNSVLVIGGRAFKGCKKLETVQLPKLLREIGESAFEYSGLKMIEIPDSVKIIGDGAFMECYDFKSIEIGKGLENIGQRLFMRDDSLIYIHVDAQNTNYDSRGNCNAIIESKTGELIAGCSSTIIPNDITVIGKDAFWGIKSLEAINIPQGVEAIANGAFHACKKLRTVTIAGSVGIIGESAFEECVELSTVCLSQGLQEIGDEAFKNCRALSYIQIPSGVESIGEEAFDSCINLKSLVLPESLTRIGKSAFSQCHRLMSINIPLGVQKIADYTFCGCRNLSSVNIPEGVNIIGRYAFCNCTNLKKMLLPKSVKLVEYGAFEGCEQLNEIYYANHDMEIEPSIDEIRDVRKRVTDIYKRIN